MRLFAMLMVITFITTGCRSFTQPEVVGPSLETKTISSTPTSTTSPTITVTSTPTQTPTPTPTLTLTPTPTLSLPLSEGTPLPENLEPLSLINFQNLTLLARWNLELESDDRVLYSEFSPDGEWLAVSLANNRILVWQVKKALLKFTLEGHTDYVHDLAFTYDSSKLISISDDRTLRIWDLNDGSLLQTIKDSGELSSVAVSPDGNIIAYGSNFKNSQPGIRLYSLSDGRITKKIRTRYQSWIRKIIFSSDGAWLIGVAVNDKIGVWQVSDGSLLQTIVTWGGSRGETINADDAALSPDDSIITAMISRITDDPQDPELGEPTYQKESWIWSVPEQKLLETRLMTGMSDVEFPSLFYTVGGDLLAFEQENEVGLYRASDGQLVRKFAEGLVHDIIITREGNLIAVFFRKDNSIQLWGVYP